MASGGATNASVVARPLPRPSRELPQHGTNADENEVTNCEYDRQLNDHDGDAKENAEDTQGDTRGSQNEGNAHRKNENSQKDHSNYSQYVCCFSHCFIPQFFPLMAFKLRGYLRSAEYTKNSRVTFPLRFCKFHCH